jgi:hypothetical protein
MTSIDLALILTAIVLVYAITAWAWVRSRSDVVKLKKITFGQEQLQFATRQHRDVNRLRKEHLRHLGGNHPLAQKVSGPRGGEGSN